MFNCLRYSEQELTFTHKRKLNKNYYLAAFYVFTDFWLANLCRKSLEIQRKSSSLNLYGSFVLACLLAACIRAFFNFHVVLKSAEKLHNNMFIAVMKVGRTPGGGGVLPSKRLLGMCMGSHFHNWIDYNGLHF